MREIKFRAWNNLKKVMIYDIERDGQFGFYLKNYLCMQYTGFKDKTGKEIYEGDIVELAKDSEYYQKGEKLEIVYNKKELCYYAYPIGFINQEVVKIRVTANKNEMFKIIGNIYENPELTKEQ